MRLRAEGAEAELARRAAERAGIERQLAGRERLDKMRTRMEAAAGAQREQLDAAEARVAAAEAMARGVVEEAAEARAVAQQARVRV